MLQRFAADIWVVVERCALNTPFGMHSDRLLLYLLRVKLRPLPLRAPCFITRLRTARPAQHKASLLLLLPIWRINVAALQQGHAQRGTL